MLYYCCIETKAGEYMEFQRARTQNQIASRQQEIILACETLYLTRDYEDITLKAISEMTSIARSTIYSYYKTKEEILLDLLEKQYVEWRDSINEYFNKTESLTKEEYARFLSDSLADRDNFIKLLSVHYTAIEKNCSLERLTKFKKNIAPVFLSLENSIHKFFPETPNEKNNTFIFLFFSLVHGLYPLTHPNENQKEAMLNAYGDYTVPDFHKYCYRGILLLINDL